VTLKEGRLRELFPNAPPSFFERNQGVFDGVPPAGGQGPDPIVKPRDRERPKRKIPAPVGHPGKYLIRIESRRRRLTDEDNLCPKYHIDALRYASIIPDDAPDTVKLQITQTKVDSPEEEMTIIEIFPPGLWPKEVL